MLNVINYSMLFMMFMVIWVSLRPVTRHHVEQFVCFELLYYTHFIMLLCCGVRACVCFVCLLLSLRMQNWYDCEIWKQFRNILLCVAISCTGKCTVIIAWNEIKGVPNYMSLVLSFQCINKSLMCHSNNINGM